MHEALRQLKRDAMRTITGNIHAFEDTLAGRHTVIAYAGDTVDVAWPRSCYMHLCGVRCDVPRSARHVGEAEYFYSHALAGTLPFDAIVIPEGGRLMKRKARVLPLLARLPELDLYAAMTRKHGLVLAVGDTDGMMTIGFGESGDVSTYVPGSNILFPRTLREQSVEKIAATAPVRVDSVSVI